MCMRKMYPSNTAEYKAANKKKHKEMELQRERQEFRIFAKAMQAFKVNRSSHA